MPCTGYTSCGVTAMGADDFRNYYQNYPVQNLCQMEFVACYQAKVSGEGLCPDQSQGDVKPDCGGWRGAAMMLYNCNINEMDMPFDMPGSPGMDCNLLYQETGVCFTGGSLSDPNAGQCQWIPGAPDPNIGIKKPVRGGKGSKPPQKPRRVRR